MNTLNIDERTAAYKYISKLHPKNKILVETIFHKASLKKSSKGMRYGPEFLLECLLLHIKSASAYEHLRTSNMLPLPDPDHEWYLMETFILMENPKFVGVDEISITSDLYFNATLLQFEGFADHLCDLPQENHDEQFQDSATNETPYADHALVLMFRPFVGSWVQPIAVLSDSVAKALKIYRGSQEYHDKFENSEATQEFLQPIERLLKELNASEESWVQTKVQPFVAPTSINMLRITLVNIIQLTEYLLNNGFDSVMTGKYNQDCLERFFGLIRTAGGSDDKPSCSSFLQLYRMLSLYYPTKRILGSNVDDAERLRLLTSYKDGLMKAYNENKKDALLLKQKRGRVVSTYVLHN
ncbi:hypothetical protein DAPPUDRAFT_263683 [Daphnia pulex]|uniref:Uncharacterized protein n=1 Tax=Daphnia pulex TaxID=6669 RepID=E9HQ85_DAPPU|nr:hypothetical protein DAPPUDRAFT_263683 [Daphnia pulex]|eukprot:EFX66100.1 hypothetical protein DAPPUDRAFT_263683 [Daphnia pulex]